MTSRNKTRSKPVPESALLGLQKVDLFRGLDSYGCAKSRRSANGCACGATNT